VAGYVHLSCGPVAAPKVHFALQVSDNREMKSFFARSGRRVVLALALVILTPLAALLRGQPVNDSSMGHDDEIAQLVQILNGAYENSLLHDSARNNLEANDAVLEDAAIQFSSRAVDELKSCGADTREGAENACALDDPSLSLGDWAEMISYASYRLENAARSTNPGGGTDDSRARVTERIESMAHLYRIVFAVSKAHLDPLQSRMYLEAAQEQLKFARQHMEADRNLCRCEADVYASRLQELSVLSDRMDSLQRVAQP
jgi:hypothetical protein